MKQFLTALTAALITITTAQADTTPRHFTKVGKNTYVSQRCYSGETVVTGSYTGKAKPLSISAFDGATGLSYTYTKGNPASTFEYQLGVDNGCYRWVLIAPEGKVVDARVTRK